MLSPRTLPLRALALLIAIAFVATACGGRPPKRERGQRQVILSSEGADEKVGRDAAAEVRDQLGLIDEPELVEYVQQVGKRLARHAPRGRFQYSFQIVDQEAPNAFALPGGFIYVSRGLLTLTNSEDELANVLGHEIIHVAARHAAARQAMQTRLPTGFNWLQSRYLAGYNRDQEREADRLGQGLAAIAGYDPAGMAAFLKELEHTERLMLGASRLPSFWSTHPVTSQRVAEAGARSKMTAWTRQPGIAEGREGYLRRIDGLAVGARASQGVFLGDRFLHSDLDFGVRFPPGWDTRNTPAAVGAVSPKRDAQVFLEFHGKGDDPEAAAAQHVEKLSVDGFEVERSQALPIGKWNAFRVIGKVAGMRQHMGVVLTFVARDGSVYRFTGVAPSFAFDRYKGSFYNVARSFRRLEPSEIDKIRENRLRIVAAQAGESLQALSERTANRWNLQQTAVMNDFFATTSLAAGQLVKVAVSESYKPAEDRATQ